MKLQFCALSVLLGVLLVSPGCGEKADPLTGPPKDPANLGTFATPSLGVAAPIKTLQYDIIDLGGTYEGGGAANAINNSGQVVGWLQNSDNHYNHAFSWKDGVLTHLGTFGNMVSTAMAVNDPGAVLVYFPGRRSPGYSLIWQDGVVISEIRTDGKQVEGTSINARLQVVGYTMPWGQGTRTAFIWQEGTIHELSVAGATESEALSINDRGQVAGNYYSGGGAHAACIWDGGVPADISGMGLAYCISNPGQVVGCAGLVPFSDAVIWHHSGITQVGPGVGYAVNTHGQVVGAWYSPDMTEAHAFVWRDGTVTELPSLGGNNTVAYDINNSGQIVGQSNGRAVLWQPVKGNSAVAHTDE